MGESPVRIVRAALCHGHAVYSVPQPGRHHNVFALASEDGGSGATFDQGFLTSDGRFVDRVEAQLIAKEAGQLEGRIKTGNPAVLYSEDLW